MLPGIAPVMDTTSPGKWPGDETEGRPRVCDSQGHGEGTRWLWRASTDSAD